VKDSRPQAELGGWLRQQRRERGWTVAEMARQLRQAAKVSGDTLPAKESLFWMIRHWERGDGGVSERYMLHYCEAFGIGAEQFGPRRSHGEDAGGGAGPDAANAAGDPPSGREQAPVSGQPGSVSGQQLAGILRDVRDGLRADAKLHQERAEQMTAGTARAALCRGQALAYAAAAEHIDAALAATDPASQL
jgi:hypothetical protein